MNTDRQLIKSLYRRFRRRPATLDARRLDLLADFIVDGRGLELDGDRLIFTSMEPSSPFRAIPLDNIHGVADLGPLLAIVLHSSIIFLNRQTLAATVHLKPPTLSDRLSSLFKF